MLLAATMLCRNEDWVAGLSLRVALQWNDILIVLLHRCCDRSAEIINEVSHEHPDRIVVLEDDSEHWLEMEMRQAMLQMARDKGATHISICDLDEIVTGNLLNVRADSSLIRGMIEAMPAGHILQLPLYNLRQGIREYHKNGLWGDRIVSVVFPDRPDLGWSGDRLHLREPDGGTHRKLKPWRPLKQGEGGVLHLWGASEQRLHEKHRMYRIMETLRWPARSHAEIEAQYSQAENDRPPMTPDKWVWTSVPADWWEPYTELLVDHLHLNAPAWQPAWCDRMIAEHGRDRFKGLKV